MGTADGTRFRRRTRRRRTRRRRRHNNNNYRDRKPAGLINTVSIIPDGEERKYQKERSIFFFILQNTSQYMSRRSVFVRA